METTGSESGFGLCIVISIANYTKETDAKLIYNFFLTLLKTKKKKKRYLCATMS